MPAEVVAAWRRKRFDATRIPGTGGVTGLLSTRLEKWNVTTAGGSLISTTEREASFIQNVGGRENYCDRFTSNMLERMKCCHVFPPEAGSFGVLAHVSSGVVWGSFQVGFKRGGSRGFPLQISLVTQLPEFMDFSHFLGSDHFSGK